MITISSDIVHTIYTTTASIIQQLWVVFAILIAITLTFYIARKLIFLFIIIKR